MKGRIGKILLFSAVMSLALAGGALAACGESHSEHVFGDWVEVTAASCEENGLKKHVCTVAGCGAEETEEIPALGHSWGVSKVTKTATCTEKGERTKTCSRCGQEEKETMPTIEHDWVISVSKQPTCTEAGEGTKTCSNCDATEPAEASDIPALGHDWDISEIKTPVDCVNDGEESKTCKRCGTEVTEKIPALGHQWMNTRVIEPATCTEAGKQEQTCQRPGCPVGTRTVDVDALGHSWQSYYTIDKQPTFEDAGSKSYHCNRCEETNGQTEIPKLDHNTPIAYEFRTLRNNGQLLVDPSVTIVVKDGTGKIVAQSTRATLVGGVFTADLLPETYTVTVENPTAGYTCSASFTVTPFDPYCNVYLTASLRQGTPSGQYKAGDVMYDFTVPAENTTAGEIKLSELLKTKKMVFLNFWFEGCTYCEQEFPDLQATYVKYKDTAAVIGVNCPQTGQTGTIKEINEYASKQRLSFPHMQNGVLKLASAFGVTGFPTSVVIDAEGVVCEILVGPQSLTDFDKLFAKYTAEDYLKTSAPAAAAVQAPAEAALPPRKRSGI